MELTDGDNFRVIQGKQFKSKIIVQGSFCYLVEKTEQNANDELVFYLKCQVAQCPARATIKDKFLVVSNQDRNQHDCHEVAGQNLNKVMVTEALGKMKKRAAAEGTSFYVSICVYMYLPL
jgi:hypothetical protein